MKKLIILLFALCNFYDAISSSCNPESFKGLNSSQRRQRILSCARQRTIASRKNNNSSVYIPTVLNATVTLSSTSTQNISVGATDVNLTNLDVTVTAGTIMDGSIFGTIPVSIGSGSTISIPISGTISGGTTLTLNSTTHSDGNGGTLTLTPPSPITLSVGTMGVDYYVITDTLPVAVLSFASEPTATVATGGTTTAYSIVVNSTFGTLPTSGTISGDVIVTVTGADSSGSPFTVPVTGTIEGGGVSISVGGTHASGNGGTITITSSDTTLTQNNSPHTTATAATVTLTITEATAPVTITYEPNALVNGANYDFETFTPGAINGTMSFTVTGTISSPSTVNGTATVTGEFIDGVSSPISFTANITDTGAITITGSGTDNTNSLVYIGSTSGQTLTTGSNTINITLWEFQNGTYFAGYTLSGAQYTLGSFSSPSGTYPGGLQTIISPIRSGAAPVANFIVGLDDTSGSNPHDFSSAVFAYSGDNNANLVSYNQTSYASNTYLYPHEGVDVQVPYGPLYNGYQAPYDVGILFLVSAGAYFTDIVATAVLDGFAAIGMMVIDNVYQTETILTPSYLVNGTINTYTSYCLTAGYSSNVNGATSNQGNSSILCATGNDIELFTTASTTNNALLGSTASPASLTSYTGSTNPVYISHDNNVFFLVCSQGGCSASYESAHPTLLSSYGSTIYVIDDSTSDGTLTVYSGAQSASLPMSNSNSSFSAASDINMIDSLWIAGASALIGYSATSINIIWAYNNGTSVGLNWATYTTSSDIVSLCTPIYTSGSANFNGSAYTAEDFYLVESGHPGIIQYIQIPSGLSGISSSSYSDPYNLNEELTFTLTPITPTFPCGNGNITNIGVQLGTTVNTPAIGILYT